jgi:hypothetical protein
MFDAKTAAAVKLEEPRKLLAARGTRGAASVWRRNCIVSSFSAHTREKRDRWKKPAVIFSASPRSTRDRQRTQRY